MKTFEEFVVEGTEKKQRSITGSHSTLAMYAHSANLSQNIDHKKLAADLESETEGEADKGKLITKAKKVLTKHGVKSSSVKVFHAERGDKGVNWGAVVTTYQPKR